MLEPSNYAAARFARMLGKAEVGGSDSHARFSLGSCWTDVPKARTKKKFLAGLRAGLSHTHCTGGSFFKLTRDVLWIGWRRVKGNPLTLPVLLLSPLAPVITGINYGMERQFTRRWASRVLVDRLPVTAAAYEEGFAAESLEGICEDVAA